MPSHHIHRFCASLLSLSEDVVHYVDELIDSGRCYVHDIGLEDVVIVLNENGEQKTYIVLGVHGALYCLYREGRVDIDYLRALALHIVLDCIDRKLKTFREPSKADVEKIIYDCINFVKNRIRISMNTPSIPYTPIIYLPLPTEVLYDLTLKLLNILQNLIATSIDTLKLCIHPTTEPSTVETSLYIYQYREIEKT